MQGLCFLSTVESIILASAIHNTRMKLLARLLFFLSFVTTQASAQDSTLIISQPVDISNEGINKVLQLSNGNTALLHFENKRHMRVKLFDKTGKEVAFAVPELKIVDMAMIEKTKLENLFEASGDIVLFFNQVVNLSNALMKVVLDGKTGKLKHEEIVAESDKVGMHVFVSKRSMGHTILLYRNSFGEDSLRFTVYRYDYYNNLKETLLFSKKKVKDHSYFTQSMASEDGDVLIGLVSNLMTTSNAADMQLLYLRNDMHSFVTRTFTLPQGYGLNKILFARNTFAGNLNVVLLNGQGLIVDLREQSQYIMKLEHNWLIIPEDMSDIKNGDFSAIPKYDSMQNADAVYSLVNFYTNANGITTALHIDNAPRNNFSDRSWTHQRKMIVSKYDDNGKQIGDAVLIPYKHAYTFDGTRGVLSEMIDRTTLHMSNSLITPKSVFVIMNDIPANQHVKEQSAVAEVIDFNNTEAVICQVDKKNVYTRKYFFNIVDSGEHKQVLPATIDYDEKTKVVAAVMRKKKGKQETFHLAWRRLED